MSRADWQADAERVGAQRTSPASTRGGSGATPSSTHTSRRPAWSAVEAILEIIQYLRQYGGSADTVDHRHSCSAGPNIVSRGLRLQLVPLPARSQRGTSHHARAADESGPGAVLQHHADDAGVPGVPEPVLDLRGEPAGRHRSSSRSSAGSGGIATTSTARTCAGAGTTDGSSSR